MKYRDFKLNAWWSLNIHPSVRSQRFGVNKPQSTSTNFFMVTKIMNKIWNKISSIMHWSRIAGCCRWLEKCKEYYKLLYGKSHDAKLSFAEWVLHTMRCTNHENLYLPWEVTDDGDRNDHDVKDGHTTPIYGSGQNHLTQHVTMATINQRRLKRTDLIGQIIRFRWHDVTCNMIR